MKYKALFLDLDGTTVGINADRPSQKISEALKRVHGKIFVSIATGRILSTAKPVIDHLDLTGPCVISNGIQIYDPIGKKIIKEHKINPKHVLPMYKQLANKYKLEVKNFNGNLDVPFDENNIDDVLSLYVPELANSLANKIIDELSHISDISVHKMQLFKHEYKENQDEDDYVAIEISDVNGSKLHGIVEVARMLGIDTHEIIGVGDGYNDFPLLMACGLKIAMGNAVKELKEIADFIVPSVEDDGVATVIDKFILA